MAKISVVICLAMTNFSLDLLTWWTYQIPPGNWLKKSGTRLFYIDSELHNLTLADCYGKDRSSSHGL